MLGPRAIGALLQAVGRMVDFHLVQGRLFLDSGELDARGLVIQHWARIEGHPPARGADFVYIGAREHRASSGEPTLCLKTPVVLSRLPLGCMKSAYRWESLGRGDRQWHTLQAIDGLQVLPSSGLRTLTCVEVYADKDILVSDVDDVSRMITVDRRLMFAFDRGLDLIVEIGEPANPNIHICGTQHPRPFNRPSDVLVRRVVIDASKTTKQMH